MKRKRVITIEIQRDVVVKALERKVRVWCPTCETEVEITIPPDIIQAQSEDVVSQIVKMIQESALHTNHSDDSLEKRVSKPMLLPAGEPGKA